MWLPKFMSALFGAYFLLLGTSGQTLQNPSQLADSNVIEAGQSLIFNCNADVVSLDPAIIQIMKVTLQRTLHSQPDAGAQKMALYNPYPPFGDGQEKTTPEPAWGYLFSPKPMGNGDERSVNVAVEIKKTQCTDAGLYECVVEYFVNGGTLTRTGQQNISARAPVEEIILNVVPQKFQYSYIEGDSITMTCIVDGPPNLSMVWLWGLASTGNYQPYSFTANISTEDPVVDTGGACPKMQYVSRLRRQLTLSDNGFMYLCQVSLQDGQSMLTHSTNVTFGITTASEEVDGANNNGGSSANTASSGGTDVGVIVGPIIGVLALIVIVLLLVYFCWYRKRSDADDKDKDAENVDSKPDLHAPPPVFYSKPNKPPKDDRDGSPPVGLTNIALDTSNDDNTPYRYANTPQEQEPRNNGPPGYTTDEDSRRPRYNRGYTSDDPVSDQGDGDSRDNARRRHERGDRDRGGRRSRSRDHPDHPRSRDYDSQREEDTLPRARPYSGDSDNHEANPVYNMAGYGDASIGTAI